MHKIKTHKKLLKKSSNFSIPSQSITIQQFK